MKAPRDDAELNLIRERAVQWMWELQEDAPLHRTEFCAWVRQSPRHIEEFLFAATVWRALDGVGPKNIADVERTIARALTLAAGDADNIVPLPGQALTSASAVSRNETPTSPRGGVKRWILSNAVPASVTAVIVLIVLAWWGVTAWNATSTYATAVGEQRTIRLVDGSILYLNAESRTKVRFTRETRTVQLLDGEALFVVAHDAARPFRVIIGRTVIQDLGTQFNVRRGIDETTVSVIEGRVQVAKEENQPSAQLLLAGEQATIARDGQIAKLASSHNVADAVAWRDRRLVFRGETLAEIVSEVNRYNAGRRFRVEGDAARHRRFAGSFSADDPQALVRFLQQYEDLSVETTSDEFIIRAR